MGKINKLSFIAKKAYGIQNFKCLVTYMSLLTEMARSSGDVTICGGGSGGGGSEGIYKKLGQVA